MKKFSRHSKIAVALLLVVMMLFSALAVTAFALDQGSNGNDEVDAASNIAYDENWYSITYVPPQNGEEAKLDVQIKTAYSKYLNINTAHSIYLCFVTENHYITEANVSVSRRGIPALVRVGKCAQCAYYVKV